jgi:GNAT superfamily N-acetyltransferase
MPASRAAKVEELPVVAEVLARWQPPAGPVIQLHPGDLGWFQRFGPERSAAAVRVWGEPDEPAAVGLFDEPDYLRLALAPDRLDDEDLAGRIVDDLPAVLPAGTTYVDGAEGSAVYARLSAGGWQPDQPWVALSRDLSDPVEDPGVAIEVVTGRTAAERVDVQRSSFDGSTFTTERWHAMAAAAPYRDARCLIARDAGGDAVAAVTVWSAGPGRPGLIEPMGVRRDRRGAGHGRAITVAAIGALRELGSSVAVVQTPSSNTGAIATYSSAGMVASEPFAALRSADGTGG